MLTLLSVRCGAKETSRSSQLTVVDSLSCCANPLSPPRKTGLDGVPQDPAGPVKELAINRCKGRAG